MVAPAMGRKAPERWVRYSAAACRDSGILCIEAHDLSRERQSEKQEKRPDREAYGKAFEKTPPDTAAAVLAQVLGD